MDRIELSKEYGIAVVKYPYNDWKNKKMRPLGLVFNKEKGQFEGSGHKIPEIIEHIHQFGGNLSLSIELQEELGLLFDGKTQDDKIKEKEFWDNHISFSVSPKNHPVQINEVAGFKDHNTPFSFQWAGIERGMTLDGRILIADDMGLGKTLQALGLLGVYRDHLPAVIVCPVSVLFNWKVEALKFLDWLDEDDITILEDGKKKPDSLISICSYRYAATHNAELKKYLNKDGIIVLDEAHTIKDEESQVGESCVDLCNFASKALILTGTPMLNFVVEIYPILLALDPVRWSDKSYFTDRYCEGHTQRITIKDRERHIYYNKGSSNLNELMLILRNDYMIRRLKRDVLPNLPKKIRNTITFNLKKTDCSINDFIDSVKDIASPILKKNGYNIQASMREIRLELGKNTEDTKEHIFKMYEESGIEKVASTIQWVKDKITAEPEAKFILFAEHKVVISEISRLLGVNFPNFTSVTIDGSETSAKKRESAKQEFQTNPDCRFSVLSIKAGYAGITLTEADYVATVQLPWSPKIFIQMEDRAHRIGRDGEVNSVILLGNNKFESWLMSVIEGKNDSIDTALDGVKGEGLAVNSNDAHNEEDPLLMIVNLINSELIEEDEA